MDALDELEDLGVTTGLADGQDVFAIDRAFLEVGTVASEGAFATENLVGFAAAGYAIERGVTGEYLQLKGATEAIRIGGK